MPRASAVSKIARRSCTADRSKYVITCPSHSVLRLSLNLPRSLVTVLASTGHDPISLMSVLCGQVAVSL